MQKGFAEKDCPTVQRMDRRLRTTAAAVFGRLPWSGGCLLRAEAVFNPLLRAGSLGEARSGETGMDAIALQSGEVSPARATQVWR
jgi:hypothetical protein